MGCLDIFRRAKKALKDIYRHAKVHHVLVLVNFFSFRILLPSLDVSTDLQTAFNFIQTDNNSWGFFTLFFVFMPFIARLMHFGFRIVEVLIKKNSSKYPTKEAKVRRRMKDFSKVVNQLPPLNIIRLPWSPFLAGSLLSQIFEKYSPS